MSAYYLPEHVARLEAARRDAHFTNVDLEFKFLSRRFKTDQATEHARHGFCRRIDRPQTSSLSADEPMVRMLLVGSLPHKSAARGAVQG